MSCHPILHFSLNPGNLKSSPLVDSLQRHHPQTLKVWFWRDLAMQAGRQLPLAQVLRLSQPTSMQRLSNGNNRWSVRRVPLPQLRACLPPHRKMDVARIFQDIISFNIQLVLLMTLAAVNGCWNKPHCQWSHGPRQRRRNTMLLSPMSRN